MPINNIQFRAEIGLYYSSIHPLHILARSQNLWKNFNTLHTVFLFPPLCLLMTFLVTIFAFPPTFFIALLLGQTNPCNSFLNLYFCIYFCIRFVTNLIKYTIACHRSIAKLCLQYLFFFQICIFLPHLRLFLLKCGDIETNPGPDNEQNLSVCHWNLNGICANNFVKLPLIEAYNVCHNYDIICLSETFLNSDYSKDDERLQLPGYVMEKSDHPSNDKRGGVCLYYKENLPIVKRDDLAYLTECLVWEIKVKKSKCFVTCLYRSPSQNSDEMEMFLSGVEQIFSSIALENPSFSLVIGDFNAKCTKWWSGGINNACGLELQALSNMLGYSQLIKEPTNFVPNKDPSCIDLIFVNQPNLVVESGVHPSLYNTCHHQIVYAKISFKVILPPSYEREVWHYNRANISLINRSIEMFDWEKAFMSISIDDQVALLNKTLLNIFRNFIPHETLKCNYKDPPWMNKEIKSALRKKNRVYKRFICSGRLPEHEAKLQQVTEEVSNLITHSKDTYFKKLGDRLNDPRTGQKTYWSVLKRVLNKTKIPNIPPILVDGIFETDFKRKAELFNVFFANQCNIFDNGSSLPEVSFRNEKRISSIVYTSDNILKIINDLNPNKAHGHDNMSIRMIKLCSKSIVRPLKLIFDSAISSGYFPDSWKKGNIVPVHKKENKNLLKNYRPISLLPIFGKIFEKIIYDSLFTFFHENNLLSENQSGFRSGDSCISQLLAITHDIFKCFDGNPSLETRGVFLDMFKAFDKVWHDGLLFKLKCYGVEGIFLIY